MIPGITQGEIEVPSSMTGRRTNPDRASGGPRYPGTFLLALREAFARLQWNPRRWLGDAVEFTDANGREQVMALENLYRRVRPADRATWPDLLVECLGQIPEDVGANPPTALVDVADRLLVRLGPPFSQEGLINDVWSQPLTASLVVTLVVDYPTTMSYVTSKLISDSGEASDAWLQRALDNLHGQTPANCLTEVHEDSGLLQSSVGDAYDSSRALVLDRLRPDERYDGWFVALPGRDHLLVLPVSARSLTFLPWLRSIATRTHRNVPYPISPEVFWVCGGRWHHFPVELEGDKAMVKPPPEFIEVIERLAPNLPEEDPDAPDSEAPDADVPN
jgi:hypothetical protein